MMCLPSFAQRQNITHVWLVPFHTHCLAYRHMWSDTWRKDKAHWFRHHFVKSFLLGKRTFFYSPLPSFGPLLLQKVNMQIKHKIIIQHYLGRGHGKHSGARNKKQWVSVNYSSCKHKYEVSLEFNMCNIGWYRNFTEIFRNAVSNNYYKSSLLKLVLSEVEAKQSINTITVAGSPIRSPSTLLPLERCNQFQLIPEGNTGILGTHIYTAGFTYKKKREPRSWQDKTWLTVLSQISKKRKG